MGTVYYNLACIDALRGSRHGALGYFRLALETGWSWHGVDTDTDLESLRGDPEFEALMEKNRRRVERAQNS